MRSTLLLGLTLFFASNYAHAQWQPIESPAGAEMHSLVQSGTRTFVSTLSGLYYMEEGDNQWTRAFSGEYERGYASVIQTAAPIVICRVRSTETNDFHIFISENNGDDWTDFSLPPGVGSNFTRLLFNGQTIIYQISNVLFVSTDLGENWSVQNQGNLPFLPNQLRMANGLFFMVDPDFNFWRSDSLSQNWTSVPIELEPGQYPLMYVDGDFMLAGISQNPIQYSHDGGQTWNNSASIASWSSDNEGFWPNGEQLYTLHQGDLYLSEDQGVTWTQISPLNSNFEDLIFFEDYTLLIESEAIYQSPDFSQTLTPVMEGLKGSTIYDFRLLDNQLLYYNYSNLRLADIDANQITTTSPVQNGLALDEMVSGGGYYYINKSGGFSASYLHEIFRVAPDGTTTFIHGSNNGSWLVSDHLKYTDDKLLYFDTAIPIYSTDNGDTWQNLQNLTHEGEYSYDYERHGDAVFNVGYESIRRLRDGETEWELVTNGLDLETFPIGASSRDVRLKSTPGALFLLMARGSDDFIEFFVSHDDGDSWQSTATDLPDIILPYLNSPQGVKNIVALGGYHIMALRDVGIAISADQGLNWTVYNNGLPTNSINQLASYDGRLIAATSRHGFWELTAENIQLQAINGRVFFDENTNGQFNAGEPLLPNVKLVLEDESDLSFTNQDGEYQLAFVNDGNFGPALENPYLTAVPGQRSTTETGTLDFALQLDAAQTDFCVSLHTDQVHRPGFPSRYYLKYQNLANAVSSANLQLTYYEFLDFENATLAPSSHLGNQLSFELGALAPLASGTIVVDFTMDVAAPLGATVLSTLEANIPVVDANTDNNTFQLEDIVVGSYDPNDIQVNLTRINPTQVANEIELEYRIRFQNTGNYPADKVIVLNKLASGLNISSVNNIITSHPVVVERRPNQELAFVFDNIQLADSTSNEQESHGFITYRIKAHPSLMLGDTIPNQAAIFFDFNAPIITNIATTWVEDFTGTRNIITPSTTLTVWPNPVNNGAPLQLAVPDDETGTLSVFDATGRCLRTIPQFDPSQNQLSTEGLPKGQYWLILETNTRWLHGQVMVQ